MCGHVSLQKLQGSWKLVGKTERRDESGSLDMSSKEGPVLQFGSTKLYLSPKPVSCEETCNETRFSFEVCFILLRMQSGKTQLA